MSAFTVVVPSVTATDVPLKLVLWRAAGAMEMSAGPKPLPENKDIAPCTSGALNAILLAAFDTLVMVGAAESRGRTAEIKKMKDDN